MQVVPVENDSPTLYTPGDCKHPVEAVAGHKKPISDGEITIVRPWLLPGQLSHLLCGLSLS